MFETITNDKDKKIMEEMKRITPLINFVKSEWFYKSDEEINQPEFYITTSNNDETKPKLYIINFHYPKDVYYLSNINSSVEPTQQALQQMLNCDVFLNVVSTNKSEFFVTYEVIY